MLYNLNYFFLYSCFFIVAWYSLVKEGKNIMTNIQTTEAEEKKRKAEAIIAIKFDTLEHGSVAYWEALANREIETV